VLIRALEPVAGFEGMARARKLKGLNFESVRDRRKLASGPGRLCQALSITRASDNGKDMVAPHSDLQVMQDGFRLGEIAVTPRVGIVKSADLPLRYVIAGNRFVSAR
jgi:DNA-3-methyladenine glycosylase